MAAAILRATRAEQRATVRALRHHTEPVGKHGAESQAPEEFGKMKTSTLRYKFPYRDQNFIQETSRAPLQLLPMQMEGCMELEMLYCGPHH